MSSRHFERILTNDSGYRCWSDILNAKLEQSILTFINTKRMIKSPHENLGSQVRDDQVMNRTDGEPKKCLNEL